MEVLYKSVSIAPGLALGLALLTGGCAMPWSHPHPVLETDAPTPPPGPLPLPLACPWPDAARYAQPQILAVPPAATDKGHFVAGCGIVKFTVNADGTVRDAELRAANPLNVGPEALAALRAMRFQPARKLDRVFVLRLGLDRDAAGHISVLTQTRPRGLWIMG
jgi:hypothetical protein